MPQTTISCQNCMPVSPCGSVSSPLAPDLALAYAHFRHALVASLPVQAVDAATPLASWRPSADLGSLVIESWAYVGDVLRLYNGVIATQSYLGVAGQRRSRRRIVALLGYQPRPAVAADANAAALVDAESVKLGSTAYRASPPGSVPHVFESRLGTFASRRTNGYSIAPVRSDDAPTGEQGTYLIDPSTAAPVRGRPVAFIWLDKVIKGRATEIIDVTSSTQSDGRAYVSMRVADDTNFIGAEVKRENVSIQSPSQRAYAATALFSGEPITPNDPLPDNGINFITDIVNTLPGGYSGTKAQPIEIASFEDKSRCSIWLDGVYRAINAGDFVILQAGAEFVVHRVLLTEEEGRTLAGEGEQPKLPLTKLTINPAIDENFVDFANPTNLVIHYNLHDIGRLTRVAKTQLTVDDIVGTTLPLEGIHDKPAPGTAPTEFILEDANGRGVLVEAELAVTDSGAATLTVTRGEWTGGLRVPVKAYGNVLRLTRGETVQDEVLGDGDAAQRGQTFKLARSPLTYLRASGTTTGIASTLEVRVDGVRWHERPSFYGAGPADAVYIVRHDDDQNTFITFGDGVRGRRLPTGVRNVRATYRHGAGAEAPPPGAINQIVKGAPGLLRVRSPIPASGGADAETAREIQRNAPASALVLGRCVSLADFAARVASRPGVRNSKVEYAWDDASLTAGVKVWYVPNTLGADLSSDIVADLQAMSEPGLVIRAAPATAYLLKLVFGLAIDPDRRPEDIEAAVRAALLDPDTGLLAPERAPLGSPLPRSALVAVARSVPGVLDVTSLRGIDSFGSWNFPTPGLQLPAGYYLDFAGDRAFHIVVKAVPAESRGCRDLAF